MGVGVSPAVDEVDWAAEVESGEGRCLDKLLGAIGKDPRRDVGLEGDVLDGPATRLELVVVVVAEEEEGVPKECCPMLLAARRASRPSDEGAGPRAPDIASEVFALRVFSLEKRTRSSTRVREAYQCLALRACPLRLELRFPPHVA